VDLTAYQCRKLLPDPVYLKYSRDELHFPIGSIQKGMKPHTKIGIKRITKRNLKRKEQNLIISQSHFSRRGAPIK
jgi:hypothetical protein